MLELADVEKKEEVIDELAQAREQTELTSRDDQEWTYEEGFTLKTIIGIIFIAAIMLPGGLYLSLVAGESIGAAAEWVTIVLFSEIARRSFNPMKKQEIYMLYYVAAVLATSQGPFGAFIKNAYLVESPPFAPFAKQIPPWVVPPAGSEAIAHRTFLDRAWNIPILLALIGEVMGRLSWMSIGYALFRITSDIEKLPFPMAPIAASGATALGEAGSSEESWRWRVFSTGSVIGILFGFVYVGIPIFTGTAFGTAVQILPIPFLDLTESTGSILPTAIVGLSLSLGTVFTGFVIPWYAVLGTFISSILFQVFLNPVLYHFGYFPNWIPGSNALRTGLATNMDFWMSVGLGISFAIGVLGIINVVRSINQAKKAQKHEKRSIWAIPKGRGDVHIGWAFGGWGLTIIYQCVLMHILLPDFPIWITVFFGALWSPLNSYVSARMIGLVGSGVGFPMIKEATIIATGYKKVDIWYAPLPMYDMGGISQKFREIELTGTKFTSVIKAEAFMFPVIFVASFAFWSFFWNSNPIPSSAFPFIQKMWPIGAQTEAIWKQINLPGSASQDIIRMALKPNLIIGGFVICLIAYSVMTYLRMPLLLIYGLIGGISAPPYATIPTFFGAWLGRKYFRKRFGEKNWTNYAPVLCAGFACGSGLIAMVSIAMALIAKSVSTLPF